MLKLILASESPRRKKLLCEAGFQPLVFPVNVSEYLEKNLTLDQQIIAIAKRKAMACLEKFKPLKSLDYLILGGDTLVVQNGTVLGKPKNSEDARRMLGLLSGKSHDVKTAVCLLQIQYDGHEKKIISEHTFIETTTVFFRLILGQEIDQYIATGEPMDKAGSYGIQSGGKKFVEKIFGDFDNVVGLPIKRIQELIQNQNWKIDNNEL